MYSSTYIYRSPCDFYIRKNPANIEWKIINQPFLGLTSKRIGIYSKFFCESFSPYTLRRKLCDEGDFYSSDTIRIALSSLCSKGICRNMTDRRRSYPLLYLLKNPLESDLYNNIEKTAFKF